MRDGVELVPRRRAVEDLRAVKDAAELEAIRAAARLADEALEEVLGRGLAGRTERDVALDLEVDDAPPRRRGRVVPADRRRPARTGRCRTPSRATWRSSRGVLCVDRLGRAARRLRVGLHATFATGEVDPRDAEVYELVRRAQEEALAAVRPGPTGREVDAVAREIIEAAGHGEHFGHGLGHGVGLEVHEGRACRARATTGSRPGRW